MTPRPSLDIPGLPGRYQPRKPIAVTPYGQVIEAIDRDCNTAVALKLLRADGTRADVARAMFRREIEALQGVSHAAIVQILDWFECEDDVLCIVLELIPGGRTLTRLYDDVRIHRISPPPLEWRVRMAVCLADAVLAAHRRGVIHRDIKPGNVLWNRDDDALKLADFGIAAVLPLTVRDPSGMTLRSFYTRPFAAPEQLLQKPPREPTDVFAFALLVASLLVLREPDETFEPEDFGEFVAPALAALAAEGVPGRDGEDLTETLRVALSVDPDRRPSLTTLRDVLARLRASLVPRPEAAFVLTTKARQRLAQAGFAAAAEAKLMEDLNHDLRVRLERGEQGERIKLYGRSLFVVLAPEDDDESTTMLAIDAGQNPGPQHESHRRAARDCPIRLRLGRNGAQTLLAFARDAEREATRRATAAIVERARMIVEIERERLPVFMLDARVEGGQRAHDPREEQIGRASGYEGAQRERVDVNGGFRLRVEAAYIAPPAARRKNLVRSRLESAGAAPDDSEFLPDIDPADWIAMFDDPKDIDILDDHGHIVGKVTGYEPETDTLHVRTDKKRRILLVGRYYVKNQQKERQLRQQELAIDALARGETARADLPHLLSEAAVHHMGDRSWVDLLQPGLTPATRVQDIVGRVLASQTAFCLQGPPGTGKTTIIAEVVAQTLERDPRTRILVCAQANDAVANAIERILKVRANLSREWIVVRDVRDERAREEGPRAGYGAAYREFVARVQQGAATRSGPTPAREALAEWVDCVVHGARQVRRDYHGLVQVWGTTTARSTRPLDALVGESYDLVIIDEAAKATVAEVLVPVVRARRLLLVGDHKQLPPFLEETTVQALQELGVSEEQAKYSLFEHLYTLVPPSHRDMLDVQFRMHPTIGDVVSRLFYDGKVRNGPGTDHRPLPPGDFDRAHRVLWLDVRGHDQRVGRTSRANDAEQQVILRVLGKLEADARRAGVKLEVAIIAAYRGHADRLQAEVQALHGAWPSLTVKAATVDAFQGREADVVLYSLVRTGDAERRFIADGRRFNVALSRARSLLVLVGDRTGARGTLRLRQLLDMIPADNQIAADVFVPSRPQKNPTHRRT